MTFVVFAFNKKSTLGKIKKVTLASSLPDKSQTGIDANNKLAHWILSAEKKMSQRKLTQNRVSFFK